MRRVAALVLAAGRSSRMKGPNKLLATFDGVPLVRRSAATALASRAASVAIVLGHQDPEIRQALAGLGVEILGNPAFADGLSTSLRLGFAALAAEVDGVLVMLADQPALEPRHLNALLEAFEASGRIVVATGAGQRGNPVVLPASLAPAIAALSGDRGARALIAADGARVEEVEIGPAALLDVDTPERLAEAGGVPAALAPSRRS